MSWSISFIGKSENVSQALKDNSAKLSGASKEEYDAVLPHLVGLVEQNYNKPNNPVIQISASGSGHNDYRSCMVSVQNLGGQLV
jgi:hypothetical protein